MHIILPLANSVTWKKYSLGQYILKEGEVPKGLYMVVKGQCKVGSEKLNIRSKKRLEYEKAQPPARKPITLKGNFVDECIREEQRNRVRIPTKKESLKEQMTLEQYKKLMEDNQRMLFFERLYIDEEGRKIDNHHVYKDMMIFFKLIEKDIFGGRVMVTKTHQSQIEGQKARESEESGGDDLSALQGTPSGSGSKMQSETLSRKRAASNQVHHEPS
mmetsp:Transcript_31482/g.48154  ORF Transcript_31482/g.48154 Transcript_31482/m.48154 type:complete len:216 (-) Transcript_31482:216-863(-)